jgi:SAM-dependent methyltransferase
MRFVRRGLSTARHMARRGFSFGTCPICAGPTLFYQEGSWRRDQYRCARCLSIPRFRALMSVLETHVPQWRELKIHESSPGGASSLKLAREGRQYIASHYFPDVPAGTLRDGFRCENLERQSFADNTFDLVISQDVFEHILEPQRAFAEIARTLKPGGRHVFTVPWYYWKETLVRAIRANGAIEHLCEPDYHANPIDPKGSLVVTEWGYDLCDIIYRCSGMTTTAVRIRDRRQGIDAEFIEVFISQKPAARAENEPA